MSINSVGGNYNQYPINGPSESTVQALNTVIATLNQAASCTTQGQVYPLLNQIIYEPTEATSPYTSLMKYAISNSLTSLSQNLHSLFQYSNNNAQENSGSPLVNYPCSLQDLAEQFNQQPLS